MPYNKRRNKGKEPMTTQDKFTKLMKHTFADIREEIQMCLDWNQGFTIDSGKLGERITFIVKDTKGVNSNGGCAFDAQDGTEAKACFTGQTYKCPKCGAKNNFYSSECHKCGSEDRKDPGDTRWGIDTKAHFLYYGQIPDYIMTFIEPTNTDANNPKFRLRVYKISASNPRFNEILEHQAKTGSHHKNFMPFSQDFYMSNPALLVDCNISVGHQFSIDYTTFDLDATESEAFMPSSLLTKKQLREMGVSGDLVLVDDVYNTFGIKKGAQGKARGQLDRNKNI